MITPQGDTPFYHELARHWLAQGLAERTVAARLREARKVGGPSASKESIEVYLASLQAPSTRRLRLSMLKTTYRLAVGLELVERDPTLLIGRVRVPRSLPKPLSRSELDRLLTQAREPARSYLILGAYAGLRACEIAAVRCTDLESYPGGWVLRIRNGKGGHEGLVPAHPKVVEVLGRDFFGALKTGQEIHRTANGVSKCVGYEMKRLGIPGGIHRARHTFGTNSLAASGDLLVVRDLLRHASIATTQIYTALDQEKPAAVVAMLA